MLEVFVFHSSRKLVCNFFLVIVFLVFYEIIADDENFHVFYLYLYVVISRLYFAINCSVLLIQLEPLPLLIFL